MKKTIILLFIILLFNNNVFAAKLHWASDLVSMSDGSLNKPYGKLDGSNLNDGDYCIVILKDHSKFGNRVLFYMLDAISGLDQDWENYTIISPGSNAGLKRWILIDPGRVVNEEGVYLYTAWASDSSGTGFTTTFNASLDYIAFLQSDEVISPLLVSHFSGLWKKYKGDSGSDGVDGLGFGSCDTSLSNCYFELPENDNHVAAPSGSETRVYKYNGYTWLRKSTGDPIQLD